MSQLPEGIYGIPRTPHVRTGHMASFVPASPGYLDIREEQQRHSVPELPPFQFKRFFYDVAYPYWQWPHHNGPYVQHPHAFTSQDLRKQSYVGSPLPIQDYQYPTVTAYNPRPY